MRRGGGGGWLLKDIRPKGSNLTFLWFASWRAPLFPHTDNLPKDVQGTKMAAAIGQHLANLNKGDVHKNN